MRNYQSKSNLSGLPDSITATRFGAGEFNSIAVELEGAVTTSGQSLAPADGTGEVTDQLSMALAIYGAGGAVYHLDTGAVNAYVLTPVSSKESPNAYFDGFCVLFEAGTVNTSASTVNVNSLGVKAITYQNGNALTGGELSGTCLLRYDLSDDRFEFIYSSDAALNTQVYVVDASQADQGATSANADTMTLYDIATLVGTSKNATAIFRHNPTAGNQTIYSFDTSLDLSSYSLLKLSFEQGAQIDQVTGDEVLTLNTAQNLMCNKTQKLTSVDCIKFANSGDVYIDWFDNTTVNCLQFAINSSDTSGGIIHGTPNGSYSVSSQTTISDSHIEIDFHGATLNITGSSDIEAIRFEGSVGTATDFAANGAVGDITITLTSVSGLSIGDLLYIEEEITGPPQQIWQLITEITNISGSDVTLSDPLPFAVSTVNTQEVRKLTPIENCALKNIIIDMTGSSSTALYGVRTVYCSNFVADNIQINGYDNGFGLFAFANYASSFRNIRAFNAGGGTGDNSDLEFWGLSKCTIEGIQSLRSGGFGPIVIASSYCSVKDFHITYPSYRGFKAQNCSMCNFSNFTIGRTGTTGFGIVRGTKYCTFNNISVIGTGDNATPATGYGFWIDQYDNNYNVISNIVSLQNPDLDIAIEPGVTDNYLNNIFVSDIALVSDLGTNSLITNINRYSTLSTDASSNSGPKIDIYRKSPSPLTGDNIGQIDFSGDNSSANEVLYAAIGATIADPTASSEDGQLNFYTNVAGSTPRAAYFRSGLVVGNPTGGDKGSGAINAESVYDDNVLLTDYVFDILIDGKISIDDQDNPKAHDFNPIAFDIDKFAGFWNENRRLPNMPNRIDFKDKNISLGDLCQRLWELAEVQSIHIEMLNQRIKKIELSEV